MLHPNFDLSEITGFPFWLWLFHAKFSYYLLQQLLKFLIYYSNLKKKFKFKFKFLILISPYVRTQKIKKKLIFLPYNFKSHVEIRINEQNKLQNLN